jgi:GNAT superfamily N-acetyltransferase
MELAQSIQLVDIRLEIANETHTGYAQQICDLIEESARVRGTGIAKRDPNYVAKKLATGHAVVAFDGDKLIGFCYVETWSHQRYVSNSGLIVHPEYRKHGLARTIKREVFNLARNLYPSAKVFGITTSGPVMKINSELGYIPVPFSELTQDDEFWQTCSSCPNYAILQSKDRKMCLCTGMLAPSKLEEIERELRKDTSKFVINGIARSQATEVKEAATERVFATDFF